MLEQALNNASSGTSPGHLSFQPGRERKLASRGGGWALRAQASVVNKIIFFYLVDNLSLIIIMGYYEN